MKNLINLFLIMTASTTIFVSCGKKENAETKTEEFQWQIDQFDDIKVMRYQVPDWDSLTLQQKQFIYYLAEATYWGRDILWDQFFKYNLMLRNTLEGIYTTYNGDKDCEEWKNFEIYLKKVWFANGIHHHYSNDKFEPKFSKEYFMSLMENSKDAYNALNAIEGMDKNEFTSLLCDIIFNPDKYQSKNNSAKDADIIAQSCNNFYENLTMKEVCAFYDNMQVPDTSKPISKGLNSKLLKTADGGEIVERYYKIGGMYSDYIEKIVENLKMAAEFAETDLQKQELNKLIEFYTTGDLVVWDEYNVMWAANTEPRVDYVNGFIETYGDPLGLKGTWEG
ncbi:MAG: dihydrofolate reductase, partial [Bacteroidales bacterium]|nr:dihydrofolate reductase [Bacteroidales bacterium]